MTDEARGTLRRLIRSGAGIAVAMAVMNVATYLFTILAARILGPREYGAVASLMGLLLVVNVVSLGLQATGARQVAATPGRRAEIEGSVMSATYRSAIALGAACLALTPAIAWALSLETWTAALMLGLTAVPLTIMGGQAGILQGEQRWLPLAGVYLGVGLGRLVPGAVLMLLFPTTFTAMLAVALGAWVPTIVGAIALGHVGPRARRREVHRRGNRVIREVATNSHALLAFFALSNADVVLARALLDEREAGLYAGGLILTKAVLFLPQFVVVIAFPSMASVESRQRMYLKGLVVVGGIGVVATTGAAALSGLAVTFIGGPAYQAIQSSIWMFALLGTLLAMVQVMVYEVVARQHRRLVLLIWAGLLAVGTVGVLVNSGDALVEGVALVYAGVFLTLLLAALRRPTQ